ncbi:MAG: YkgJ family cysteine cluster protein [Proteobacteria bacterium]|nr:MAG: YkgJ family cysteine cluster protein [Pseudomonadota bacterium]
MIENAPKLHPCQTCGACCNSYRVSFHYSEMLAESHAVPEGLSHQTSPYQNAMNGTDQANPRCIAFVGEVGESSSCSIYANRPGCCRLFKASFENGVHDIECDRARAGKHMVPLTAEDWR